MNDNDVANELTNIDELMDRLKIIRKVAYNIAERAQALTISASELLKLYDLLVNESSDLECTKGLIEQVSIELRSTGDFVHDTLQKCK